ncbi:DUF5134 domain-containing protein [Parasphingorhabdus pacifica]
MAGPVWSLWMCAVAMLAVTVHGGVLVVDRMRAKSARARSGLGAELLQVLMGVGMLVMLLPTMGGWTRPVWGVVFALGAGWTGAAAYRASRPGTERAVSTTNRAPGRLHLHHTASSAAMAYMFLAAQPHGASPASSGPVQVVSAGAPAAHSHGAGHGNAAVVLEHDHSGLVLPLLAWFLVVHSVLRAGWLVADLVNSGRTDSAAVAGGTLSTPPAVLTRPGIDIIAEILMALTTAYMLLIML